MSLSFQIPWFVFLIAAVLAAAISYQVYRSTVPPVSLTKRLVLSTLRGLALTLLIFAVCEPLFKLVHHSTLPPVVAVLVDNSLSMAMTDDAGNREQILRSMVSEKNLHTLLSPADPEFFTFASSLHKLDRDTLHLDGTTTDIASALRSLRAADIPRLKAVILLSDGNYNSGENPLYEAEKFGTPIFSVGIGDSLEQKDVVIEKILTNSVAYVQSVVPLDATIKVSGFQDRTLEVKLMEEGKELARQSVAIPPSAANRAREYPVHFSFTPAVEGTKKYTLTVPALEGEVTKKNNAKSVLIKILKNKMRVAVIAGAPNADVGALMQALRADRNIESSLAVQRPNGSFEADPLGKSAALSSADCLVLVNFPTDGTSESVLQSLAQRVAERSLPLFFIGGRTMNIRKLQMLNGILPFTAVSDKIDEQLVFPNIPPQARFHLLVQPNENVPFDWTKLPPLYSSIATFSAKPEAVILATTKIQGMVIDNPLLVARTVARAKSYAVLGYGISRWKLMAGASAETEIFFDPWISTIVRWLVTRDDDKHVRVDPEKEIFSQGEVVSFTGQVYDPNYMPVDQAEIRVEISSLPSAQHVETILRPLHDGRYEGEIESLPEGDYTFAATAKAGGAEIGKSEGRFSIGEQSIEFASTKMNKAMLQQLAAVSGGSYADAAQFDSLVNSLASRPFLKSEEQLTTSEFELWNLPSLLSVIVALFGAEWFIRKQSGML